MTIVRLGYHSSDPEIDEFVRTLVSHIGTSNPFAPPELRHGTIAGVIENVRHCFGNEAAKRVKIVVH